MVASPSNGAEIARVARSGLFSRTAKDLEPYNEYLGRLNRNWLRHVVNGGDPEIASDRRTVLLAKSMFGLIDRLVKAESAAAMSYLGDTLPVNKGHQSITKANDTNDPTFVYIRNFIENCIEYLKNYSLVDSLESFADIIRNEIRHQHIHHGEPWSLSEREYIKLRTKSSNESEGLQDGLRLLECQVRSEREGVLLKPSFRVCICLDGHYPEDDNIDYIYSIGKGLLNDTSHVSIADRLRVAGEDQGDIDAILGIKRIQAIIHPGTGAERVYEYRPDRKMEGSGFVIANFVSDLDEDVCESVGRASCVSLDFTSIAHVDHGWYFYNVRRTLINGVYIELQAPFPVRFIRPYWWCDPEVIEEKIGSEIYCSKVAINTLVPSGTNAYWIFGEQDK